MELDISKYNIIWNKNYYKNIELDWILLNLKIIGEINWSN